ncbi:MAG: universal stress protein [Candidatus Promineifilaceae bacterium]
MAHVSHKLSSSLEGALAGGGDPATSPLYVFGPFLKLIVGAGVASITFGTSIWLVILTIALVSAMYRLVMVWITDGSGGSGLSEEELGSWAVKLNASITFVEYTLTFLVSMAALVTFVADRFPSLNQPLLGLQYRTFLAIGLSIMTGWLVNRGPKVAARTFGPATAGVLLLMWIMVFATIFRFGLRLPDLNFRAFSGEYLNFTLGGYVRILAVMTGIEVFANLVAAYQGEPRRKSRMAFQSLLIVMGTTSIVMLVVGPAIRQLSDPFNTEVSVFTQTMDQLLPQPLSWLGTLVGVLVLLSASAASAQGLQNLALGLRLRNYVPSFIGHRNAYEVAAIPVWIEVALVSICFLAFGTNEETYLAIYAAGVFILLSMTGWAATKRLFRQAGFASGARNYLALGGTATAAALTSLATIIIFFERFVDGAWAYFVLLPVLYLLFTFFRHRLGEPTPVEERRGLLFAERRYLPKFEQSPVAFNRLLVPLDGSSFAEQALPLAQALGLAHDSQLTLLSVRQGAGDRRGLPAIQGGLNGDLSEYEYYLGQVAARLKSDGVINGGVRIQPLVVEGRVADQITAVAAEQGADALVMSTHGRSRVSRMLLGSVSSEVLQQSTRPLLLVQPGQMAEPRPLAFSKLMVALDGSSEAELVLPYARALAARFGSEIILLSVPDDLQAESQLGNLQRYLEDVAGVLTSSGLSVRSMMTGSDPAHTIVEMARANDVDLVMLTTHGRGVRARLLFGSVADTVVRHYRRPIFMVPVRADYDMVNQP